MAEDLARFEETIEKNAGASQREIVSQLDIPRSTLRYWQSRKDSIDAAPEVIEFFESPAGVAFLHRLVLGAHFVFTLCGPCGIRPVCLFLELTGLNKFVADSYGAQQKVSSAMEEAVAEFGREEKKRLAEGMAPKQITVCEDETFHENPCLVATEPVSNYILLEKYASGRKAEDWTSALNEATEGLAVEVIQCTSDEGRGIVSHVEKDLGSHHSPDLFHVNQEINRGTSVALESRRKKAEKELEALSEEVSRHKKEKEIFLNEKRPVGRPPEFDKRIEKALEREKEAMEALKKAEEHQACVKEAVDGISTDYHPYDLNTGAPRSPEEVSSSLEKHFSKIEETASEADLPERCNKKIMKAKRVLVQMTATIAFFFLMVRAKVEALSLAPEVESAVYNHLIPGIYLDIVSKKAKTKEQREALRKKSGELLAPFQSEGGLFEELEKNEIIVIEQTALECAQLFQRSSSCVEGRNGHLALYHHSLHRLSDRKLEALTSVHNYFIKRNDGTTPAERFFGSKPGDMFEWLLDRINLPGRPAQKRSQPAPRSYLLQDAA